LRKWIVGFVLVGIMIFSVNVLTFTSPEYDVVFALVTAEKVMKTDESVRNVATSYDGKGLIKFRIVVKEKIDNWEAKRLVFTFMNEIENSADVRKSGEFWTKFALEFDIIDDTQVLFQGINNKENGRVYWIF